MTLHTRVMVTSPGVDPAAVFVRMRQIIGAGEQYDARTRTETEHPWQAKYGTHEMTLGQGLPALMWVDFAHEGQMLGGDGHEDYCDDDCDGSYHDPAGHIEINYDTAYGYRANNNASCGDLHAWITQEIGLWLDTQGASWEWYDESGDGWNHGPGWGTLGDPEIGRIGSTVRRLDRDPKRAFGNLVTALIENGGVS